ncbi:uncharacterized protein LOC108598082 [Drosophila busckii]|uniref:uncharacterized protein LOC108598082 n=1 Tax=Drosophila busckii TaxID=30019 RepID=UPI001432C22E|nr:uncharacterized protein LOC108598082 [Drosophila busckii]
MPKRKRVTRKKQTAAKGSQKTEALKHSEPTNESDELPLPISFSFESMATPPLPSLAQDVELNTPKHELTFDFKLENVAAANEPKHEVEALDELDEILQLITTTTEEQQQATSAIDIKDDVIDAVIADVMQIVSPANSSEELAALIEEPQATELNAQNLYASSTETDISNSDSDAEHFSISDAYPLPPLKVYCATAAKSWAHEMAQDSEPELGNNYSPVSIRNHDDSSTDSEPSASCKKAKQAQLGSKSVNTLMAQQQPLAFIASAMQGFDAAMQSTVHATKASTDESASSSRSSSSSSSNETDNVGTPKQKATAETKATSSPKVETVPLETNAQTNTNAKDSESDDSNWQRQCSSKPAPRANQAGRDFYEDVGSSDDEWLRSDDNIKELRSTHLLDDYEKVFEQLRQLIEQLPNRFKYEAHGLMFPLLALVYLKLIAVGRYRKGKTFVESAMRYMGNAYSGRVDKLLSMQTLDDIPKQARKLLVASEERIVVKLYEDCLSILVIHMRTWPKRLQTVWLKHFELQLAPQPAAPCQLPTVGSTLLEKVFWGTTETAAEVSVSSPQARKRKRARKLKPSPTRQTNMPSGNRLYTPLLRRWELERQKEDEERRVPLNREQLPSVYLYTASASSMETVVCASFSNKCSILCLGTVASAIHIYSLTACKLLQLKPASCLKHLEPGFSGIDDNMMDASSRKLRRTLYGHQAAVYGCVFAPNDRFLLSCSQDRTVRCWCLLSWSCIVIYPGHASAIYGIVYAPLGYYFATVSDDRTARVWAQDNKKSLCILVGHLAEVICCKFHPNRHYLATGSADCTVRLWDIIKAIQVRIFSGHRDAVNALAFSGCGRYLVSGGDDHFVLVHDLEKQALVRALAHHTGSINCIEFAQDNKIFLVGGQDCLLSLWDFERLTSEYKPDQLKTETETQCSDDILINSYASKATPFYALRVTARNLVMGVCVRSANEESEQSKQQAEAAVKYGEWLEFLDILILKACCPKMSKSDSEQQTEFESHELMKLAEDTCEDKTESKMGDELKLDDTEDSHQMQQHKEKDEINKQKEKKQPLGEDAPTVLDSSRIAIEMKEFMDELGDQENSDEGEEEEDSDELNVHQNEDIKEQFESEESMTEAEEETNELDDQQSQNEWEEEEEYADELDGQQTEDIEEQFESEESMTEAEEETNELDDQQSQNEWEEEEEYADELDGQQTEDIEEQFESEESMTEVEEEIYELDDQQSQNEWEEEEDYVDELDGQQNEDIKEQFESEDSMTEAEEESDELDEQQHQNEGEDEDFESEESMTDAEDEKNELNTQQNHDEEDQFKSEEPNNRVGEGQQNSEMLSNKIEQEIKEKIEKSNRLENKIKMKLMSRPQKTTQAMKKKQL